jgi:hypothetical protein
MWTYCGKWIVILDPQFIHKEHGLLSTTNSSRKLMKVNAQSALCAAIQVTTTRSY